MMTNKALFGRKIANLKELKELTQEAGGRTGSAYQVTREVELKDGDFRRFAADFLADQPWISGEDGGINQAGERRCLRVSNQATGETVLVNSEGYSYARYVALESPCGDEGSTNTTGGMKK